MPLEGSHHATFAPGATCRAILSQPYRVGEYGFEALPPIRCLQSVGVRTFVTKTGERVGYCPRTRPDGLTHEEVVRTEADRADAVTRATSDWSEAESREAWGR